MSRLQNNVWLVSFSQGSAFSSWDFFVWIHFSVLLGACLFPCVRGRQLALAAAYLMASLAFKSHATTNIPVTLDDNAIFQTKFAHFLLRKSGQVVFFKFFPVRTLISWRESGTMGCNVRNDCDHRCCFKYNLGESYNSVTYARTVAPRWANSVAKRVQRCITLLWSN